MKGIELLPLIKATSKADRYSENLMKWVRKYKNRELIVAIATEGKRVFDSAKTQSSHLYIGYTPIEDGYLMGSRLSEILCNGAKTSTWAFHGLKFVEVPDWWQRYIEGAKCCIDPEHWLYADRERWEVAEDGKTRRCLWCGKHTECSAELLESSIGDWVDAVEAINTISRLRRKIKIMSKCLERIRTEENTHQYQWMPVWAGDALHEAGAINP